MDVIRCKIAWALPTAIGRATAIILAHPSRIRDLVPTWKARIDQDDQVQGK